MVRHQFFREHEMNKITITALKDGPLDGHAFRPMKLPDNAFTDDSFPFTSLVPPAGFKGIARGQYQVRRAADGTVTAVHVPGPSDISFTAIPPKPQPAPPAAAEPERAA
jgi:hypothetical protein